MTEPQQELPRVSLGGPLRPVLGQGTWMMGERPERSCLSCNSGSTWA